MAGPDSPYHPLVQHRLGGHQCSGNHQPAPRAAVLAVGERGACLVALRDDVVAHKSRWRAKLSCQSTGDEAATHSDGRYTSMVELDTGRAYIAYLPPDEAGTSQACFTVYVDGRWTQHGLLPTVNAATMFTVPVTTDGAPLLVHTLHGTTEPAAAGKAPKRQLLVRRPRCSLSRSSSSDTFVVINNDNRDRLVGVPVATAERSNLHLEAPEALREKPGAGLRLRRTTFPESAVRRYVGRCTGTDLERIEELAALEHNTASFALGRIVYVGLPGESSRHGRPAVVVRCAGADVTVRAITSSPHRVHDSGHELLDPTHIKFDFRNGKVRDIDHVVHKGDIVGVGGAVSSRDLAGILAMEGQRGDTSQA